MINLVTLSSQRYLVDVGMNARGPIVPLLLLSDNPAFSIFPRKARLLHGWIPEHTISHTPNLMWRLEVCNDEDGQWIPTYAFSEIEFLPVDFEMMNWYTTTSPRSFLTHKILVGRMIIDTETEEIIGDLTLFERALRKRIHGKIIFEKACKSESEKVKLLEEHFEIKFKDCERKGIKGKESIAPCTFRQNARACFIRGTVLFQCSIRPPSPHQV